MRSTLRPLLLIALCGCGQPSSPPPAAQPAPVATPPAVASTEPELPRIKLDLQPESPPAPEPVFRPSDHRPRHEVARAADLGIARYESEHLELFTDIPAAQAEALPSLVDALIDRLSEYFGPLPPNREGTPYQLTGYVLSDVDRFRSAGMLPDELPQFEHGRHRGLEFWLFDQKTDDFREHLVLHEATHCFMTTMPGPLPPIWYMEGMAEYFAVHQQGAKGWEFGVIPKNAQDYTGWGGLQYVQRELAEDRFLSLAQVFALGDGEFAQSKTVPYAWSWWVCTYLNQHPAYRDRFRQLGQHVGSSRFSDALQEMFPGDVTRIEQEWWLATHALGPGYEVERSALAFPAVKTLATDTEHAVAVQPQQGWQPTGLQLQSGEAWSVNAVGRTALAQQPRPWESTAEGITIRYASGRPIGRLLGLILPEATPDGTIPVPIPLDLGASSQFQVETPGLLYLRVNDRWNELADNTGALDVTLKRIAP